MPFQQYRCDHWHNATITPMVLMTPKMMAILSLVFSPLLFDWLVAVGAVDVVVTDVLDVVCLVEETWEGVVVDDCEGVMDDVVVEVGGGGGKEEEEDEEGGIAC